MVSASSPSLLRVGVVGLGVGEQHARRYHANPRCKLLLVCDLDAGRAARVAGELGAAVATDFSTLLADERIDIVSIASYDDAHFEQVLAALQLGKHVFVEKPICQTLDQARTLKEAWLSHGGRVKLQSNLVLRTAPLYAWLRSEIHAGRFGEVYSFAGEYLYGRLHKITDGWRKHVADYSVMQGGGIHLIDLMLWLTGRRAVSVTAMGSGIATMGTGFTGLDFVTASIHLEGGAVGTIAANFACVHRHQHVVSLFGTSSTFLYDDAGARVHTTRDPNAPPVTVSQHPLPSTKSDLIEDFVAAIVNDSSVDTELVFDGISVSIACDRAAASGERHQVEYA